MQKLVRRDRNVALREWLHCVSCSAIRAKIKMNPSVIRRVASLLQQAPAGRRLISGSAAACQDLEAPAPGYGPPAQEQQQFVQPQIVLETVDRYEVDKRNVFWLTGNVVAHPFLKVDRAGKPFTNITVARNSRRRDKSGNWVELPPEFYTFFANGALAQAIMNQVRKGQKVTVESYIRSDKPTNPVASPDETAPRSYSYKLLAKNITLIATTPRQYANTYREFEQPAAATAAGTGPQ